MKGTFKNINKNYLLMEFSPLSWLIISKIMLIILCHARKVLHPQGLSIRKSVHYIRREKSAYFSHKLNKFLIFALSHVFPSFFRFFNGFPHPLSLSLSLLFYSLYIFAKVHSFLSFICPLIVRYFFHTLQIQILFSFFFLSLSHTH